VAVALGAGLYLPSLPSQIGALYEARDPRRTWAYNIYYMGMNTGSLIAPLICGTLGELFGWHWGFGAAGIGMLLGVAIYVLGARHLPADAPLPQQKRSSSRHGLPGWHRFGLMAVLALCVMLYRGANEQTGNTLALWLDTGVDRRLAGLTIPMTWFQSLNPVMVLLLTPLLVFHWKGAAARGSVPSDVARMAMGAAILAGGFVFLAGVVRLDGASTNPGWVVAFFVILTVGELYMMPAALAVFNRLAPTGFVALGAALWFLTASGGNLIAGALGTLWSSMPPVAFFLMLAAVSASAGLFLRLLVRAVAEADARIADEARSPRPRMA
ncbi:MAG: MFS transporter, partial [Sphingomonadales bacterium]